MDDDDRFTRLNAPHWGYARVVLSGGPFDGEEALRVPPDTHAPAQIVWGGWFPWGFCAYLYEWTGERHAIPGGPADLIYRPPIRQDAFMRVMRGRRFDPDDIPPLLREDAELYAAGAVMLIKIKNEET